MSRPTTRGSSKLRDSVKVNEKTNGNEIKPECNTSRKSEHTVSASVLNNEEFGEDNNPKHRFSSRFSPSVHIDVPVVDDPPYFYLIATYWSYLLLIILGHIRDFFGKRYKKKEYKHLREQNVSL